MTEFKLRDRVRGRGVEGIISCIALAPKTDDVFYILRHADGSAYYCDYSQLEHVE